MAILFILLLVFSCQKLIKILGAVVDGEIPISLALCFFGLAIPEMGQFILPLSLFLGLLVTFGKLHEESEIIVMHACGISKIILIKVAMILSFFTSILATTNVMWGKPWSFRYQEETLKKIKTDLSVITSVSQKRFQQISNGSLVFYIENATKDNHFCNLFLIQFHRNTNLHPSIVIAKSGQFIQRKDGIKNLVLNKGMRFEEINGLRGFRIVDFERYQSTIYYQPTFILNSNNPEKMSINTLWKKNTNFFRSELHWRITLIFVVFIMALIAIPLSVIHPRKERILTILPGTLLSLIFFLLQTLIKSNASKGKIDPALWVWMTNGVYLLLAASLNLWNPMLVQRVKTQLFLFRNFFVR